MSFEKEQLQKGEEIIIETNQHPIVLLKPTLYLILAAAIVLSLVALGEKRWQVNLYWLLLLIVPLLVSLVRKVIVRANEEYIITNHRVIKQEGVFAKTSFDAPLDKVNNIFHSQTVIGRLLNYGDVGLETASEIGLTEFQYIPDPLRFKNTIVAERDKRSRLGSPAEPSQAKNRENVPELLERLAKLRDQKIITEEEFQESKRRLLGNL